MLNAHSQVGGNFSEPLMMMKNPFYFTSKALFNFKFFKFLF